MRTCRICGNDFRKTEIYCPFCETPVSSPKIKSSVKKKTIKKTVLKTSLPSFSTKKNKAHLNINLPGTCHVCGNELREDKNFCPFCRTPESEVKITGKVKKITEYNIKFDLPIRKEAGKRLFFKILEFKKNKHKIIKVIHGYGSSGKGGVLRYFLREKLDKMKYDGLIREYLPGEDFSMLSEKGKTAIKKFPLLKTDSDFKKSNKGITMVIL
ncbi:MAG: hypothetical protein CSB55_05940 [Candidatus Cloacimonadota bacterium]|nr:MAG: hypothetical protein CSB55_05940 [Candidatus Cloacimonadota bacterium]